MLSTGSRGGMGEARTDEAIHMGIGESKERGLRTHWKLFV